MMKMKEWENSVVTRFLELLTAQVLHSTSGAPCWLQFHILDLYMTELAAVGSAELTAAQNLTFIDPFCKTASKTKDRILLKAICGSIFSAILDQAPFIIEDLLKEAPYHLRQMMNIVWRMKKMKCSIWRAIRSLRYQMIGGLDLFSSLTTLPWRTGCLD
ncbi:ribosomal RNA processing protein 1 homolog A isoform X2 [Oncorhynchus kisutch]|uniref:ribosomal RNA processing protein 1 homolog A isoform X2 n=1 Tax=Oncorhynchus kisutch TaxID=8019 RepID=UPI0012DD2982|nr:ribosomal RNA processing protein 1 homolog A isoform X2 [Oncorhynchus kisutch]XP_031662038.1 ribosomal RNA processing protein 1 homolog A isoform X2 [Oncorhynchus kisutch]XP_031662039.1 ribosomal RNA processing protein 1 homolog A isoform X2 [Oncorhynchus kisutch]